MPARSASGPRWAATAFLLLAGCLMAFAETRFPSIAGGLEAEIRTAHFVIGALALGVALAIADRYWTLAWRSPAITVGFAFLGSVAAGWLGGVSWPNSGDEHSYVYLADTLLAGRFWNPPPPDLALFDTFHVIVTHGRMFSPYPPGWSGVLVPFEALGASWLANPLLTALLGIALAGALFELGLRPPSINSALVLVMLTPFTLFQGGSLFPHMMTAVLVSGIVWAQLADERRPRAWRKIMIGASFGILLLTRYDVVAIVAALYALDRLAYRRLRALGDGAWVIAGMLPFIACHLAYDFAVTGDPLQLPILWAPGADSGGGEKELGVGFLFSAILREQYWMDNLAQFGGLPVLALAVPALVAKVRQRRCRFYDFLLPAAIVAYAFVPFFGGHQYGPRYWFFAWPLAILTVATASLDVAGRVRIVGKISVAFDGLSAACLVFSAAAFLGLMATTRVYIDARRAVFTGAQPQTRAIVLLPNRSLVMWPWQMRPIIALNNDFTRNDVNFDGFVLYGRVNAPDALEKACALPDRAVFRWVAPGQLVVIPCS